MVANNDDGNSSLMLGTNKWGGKFAQRTGFVSTIHGDWGLSYENDGTPFSGNLGDGGDSYRSAAGKLSYQGTSLGLNLFTGFRNSDLEASRQGEAISGGNGTTLPFGEVSELGTKHRLGALYLEHGGVQLGIDSDKYVRHPIQDILVHGMLNKQRGFTTESGSVNPYFQYSSSNSASQFTHW